MLRLTKRWFLRSWAVILAVGLLSTLLAGCATMEEKRDKFMREGQELFDKGDFVRARLQFKNALQIDPKYAPGYLWLAKTEMKLENWRGAFSALSQAVELDPKMLEAQILLGRIYLSGKRLAEAENHLKAAQEIEPQNPEVLLLAAGVAAAQEKYGEAVSYFEAAKKTAPQKVEIYLLQAQMEANRKNWAAAVAVLDEGIQRVPENIDLYLTRGRLALAQRDFATAESNFRKAAELAPQNTTILQNLAQLYQVANRPQEAEEVLRRCIALEPDKEQHYVTLARLLSRQGKRREAEELLKEFLSKYPDNNNARFALADFYLASQRERQALKTLQEIVDRSPTTPAAIQAKNRMAAIHSDRGRLEAAQKLVEEVLNENPKDMTAIRIKGLIALAQKNGLEAVSNFRIVVNDQPNNPEARLMLARAHLVNNELEQARTEAKKAIELKPDYYDARRFLYGTYIQRKDYDGLIQLLKTYLNYDDKDYFNLMTLGEVYAEKGDLAAARATMQRLIKIEPRNPVGYFQLARLELRQKNRDGAIKYLQEALQANPNFLDGIRLLAAIYQEANQLPKVIELIQKLQARSPDNPFLYQMLGELYLLQRKPAEAAAALEQAIARDPRMLGALRLLVLAYSQNPDLEQVKQQLAAKANNPQAPRFYILAEAMLYERLKEYQRAEEVYQQMIQRGLFVTLAKNNLAYLLAEHLPTPENLAKALHYIEEALEEAPEDPNLLDTKGWILCKQGDFRQAQTYLTQAAETAGTNPTIRYHLAFCEAKLGEREKARADLEKLLELKVNFPERAAAETLLLELRQGQK